METEIGKQKEPSLKLGTEALSSPSLSVEVRQPMEDTEMTATLGKGGGGGWGSSFKEHAML